MCFVRGLAWLYKFYFNSFCERFTLFDYLLTTVRTAWPGWANTHSEYSLVPYSIKHFLRCLRKKKNIDKRTQLKGKRKLSVLKCNRKAPCERIYNKYNKLLSTFLFIYLDSPIWQGHRNSMTQINTNPEHSPIPMRDRPHHRGLCLLLFSNSSVGSFTSPCTFKIEKMKETRQTA